MDSFQSEKKLTKQKEKNLTATLAVLAALIAVQIVLSRFLSIATWNLKIGFGFIPVVIAAVLYGPVGGACVGAASDFLGAILFPIGAYFPGYSLTAALSGILYGVFLKKKRTPVRIVSAVLLDRLFGTLLLNSLWISMISGSPFLAQVSIRSYQAFIMAVVQIVVIFILDKMLLGRVVQLNTKLKVG